jgi:glycosyltransferase involved in cell wall biosynthesis
MDIRVNFIVPGNIDRRTGGSIYDRNIHLGLREIGVDVVLHQLMGDFPSPRDNDIEEYRQILGEIPENDLVVIDGLVAGMMDDVIKGHFKRLKVISLVHLPLGVTPWNETEVNHRFFQSERTTLQNSRAVIITGEPFRTALSSYKIQEDKIFLVEPGRYHTPRKQSYPELPCKLLCVANIIKRKGYHVLLEALSELQGFEWELTCCGSLDHEPSYFQSLNVRIMECGLEDRIVLKGSVSRSELESEFLQADLFVFPSLFETYGMALIEAAGYGLPIVTSIDHTIIKTIPDPAAIFFHPGDDIVLKEILSDLMSDAAAYSRLCTLAKNQKPKTLSWSQCAERFYEILTRVGQS